MKDNQKKYLDRVVSLLVRDTIIDYDNKTLTFPSTDLSNTNSFHFQLQLFPLILSLFSMYCKDTYGLGEEEIDYVWYQYRDIIKDKLTTK